ncbi:MAG: hypothetical protein ACREDD_04985 [Methylocella sp.]
MIALVTGSLFRVPEQRTSKNGRCFVSATVLAHEREEAQFVKVAAFSETARTELMRLAEGEMGSVQGPLSAAPAAGSRHRAGKWSAASGDPDDSIPF